MPCLVSSSHLSLRMVTRSVLCAPSARTISSANLSPVQQARGPQEAVSRGLGVFVRGEACVKLLYWCFKHKSWNGAIV